MLVQRRRRWADVVQMLYTCFVFAVMYHVYRDRYASSKCYIDEPIMLTTQCFKYTIINIFAQKSNFLGYYLVIMVYLAMD